MLDVLDEGVVWLNDDDQGLLAANRRWLEIVGLDDEALQHPHCYEALRPRRPDGSTLTLPVPSDRDVPIRITRVADGRPRDLVLRRAALPGGTSVVTVRDRTEARRASARLEALEARDPLTGLPNRTAALHAVDAAVAAGEPFAVLLVDLDGFHAVNVGHGQAAGDAVLKEVAARLRAVAPRRAEVARFGGDELLVLAPLEGVAAARATAERIRDAFAGPFTASGGSGDGAVTLTASIGIACAGAASDGAGLISAAEAALDAARARGRGLVAVFDDGLRAQVDDRLSLVADLRRAIDADGLGVAYQPIVALRDGVEVVGVEALARWTHPTRGEISPAVFVELAEEAGLVRALGRRVLARACHEVARLRAELPGAADVRLSVNVSARQVVSGLLEHDVRAALAASGLPPRALALELTESALMDDSGPVLESLARLRAEGVRLLIDDFGTGYSSLTRLRRLPVDGLKVDRSFVAGLGSAAVETAIVEAVLTMARALRLPVVAEGVEEDGQAALLRALGCPLAQGFLLGRPMGLAELRERLRSRMDGLRAVRTDR